MKRILGIAILFLLPILAAGCGGETAAGSTTPAAESTAANPALRADFDDALSLEGQLAVGTLLLEDGDLTVDSTQAETLLVYWNALQNLRSSGTAAQAELDAVVAEIERAMTAAQIAAIAAMGLTNAEVTALVQAGELALGQAGFGRGAGAAADAGEGAPPAGGGVPGGGPGGGFGGGAGGGRGGLGGIEGGAPDAGALATRQAQIESGDSGGFQEQALTRVVITLLEEKTGVMSIRAAVQLAQTTIAAETGLAAEEVQAAFGAGTVAQLITDSGGDVAAVRSALLAALDGEVLQNNQTATELVDLWLGPAAGE